jgi:hypothetical protein
MHVLEIYPGFGGKDQRLAHRQVGDGNCYLVAQFHKLTAAAWTNVDDVFPHRLQNW